MPPPGPLELAVFVGLFVQIAVVVIAIVAIGRWLLGRARSEDQALTELRARLARGEIDEAEYERLRSVLQRH